MDKPLTEHETEPHRGTAEYPGGHKANGLVAGMSCMQGWRVDMEVRSRRRQTAPPFFCRPRALSRCRGRMLRRVAIRE